MCRGQGGGDRSPPGLGCQAKATMLLLLLADGDTPVMLLDQM